MHYLFHILWCAVLNYFVRGQESATNFYKFIDSFASSTYISEESGSSLYDAKRAIQNNPSYWCSSGNHSKDEEVTWTGYLNTKGFIKGVKISWEYSPELVNISVSADGENYKNVIPYKKISGNESSFDEIYFFKKLEEVISIRIGLKNAIHKYFGIREVKIIGGGNPYFLLLSGITSEHEMCLQVEEGLINNDNTSVILDSCINALASGDGRELWKTNSNNQIISAFSDPPKCLAVINLDNLENNKVVLYDCLRALEDGDGKSNWVFESNSQIRLQRNGEPLCISQKNMYGNTPGIHDILLNMDVSVDSSSTLDDDHNADNTIDGNLNSFWASATFPDSYEHLVYFIIDLNTFVEISRVKIFWEYPPLHYSIAVSTENQNYKIVLENLANPSFVTIDTLKNLETRYIKISMIKPHADHGQMGDQFLYGIRSIEVQANNLETILSYCRDAANSDDARDKYFVEYITEFDQDLTNKLINLEDDVSKNVNAISENLSKLEELLPSIETCLQEKKNYDEELKESKEKANELNDKLSSLVSVDLMHDNDLVRLGLLPGDSSSYPASDCAVIKNIQEIPYSGFYWIKPKCAPEPLKVYCDMDSSTSMYIWNGNPPKSPDHLISSIINSVDDIRQHCAEVGLEPLILRSKGQLDSLILSLKKIGFILNGKMNIPLAYDYSCDHGSCSGKFHDLLNGNIDLTTLIYLKASESPDNTKIRQTAGISYDDGSFKFFNLETSDISAIVCSTNSTENDSALHYLSINCETTALEDYFNAIVNTNIVAFCPLGCDSEKFQHAAVYGSKGIYSDNSSICRAAIHSGVIDNKGGLVNVTIESGLDRYVGSLSNNIESISLNKEPSGLLDIISGKNEDKVKQESSIFHHRTIRLSNLADDCPMDLFQYKQTSFVQRENVVKGEKEVKSSEDENTETAHFHELINELLSNIDAIHGVDPSVISAVQDETIRIIEKTKKELKPADVLSKKQIEDAINLYNLTENLALYLYDLSGKYIYDLEKLKERLEELKRAQKVAHNFGTFKLNYETMNFSSHFHVFDSKLTKNKPSTWGYVDTDILGHKNCIGQMSSISNREIGEGYYAKLKGLNFYDSEIRVSVLSKGTGCLGIVFRAKDDFNFYLFDICDQEGKKRLSKVENGHVYILKEIHGEVSTNDKWVKYKIVTNHANIDIYEVDDNINEVKILSSLDERFLSGTVGLYSQIHGQGSFFDDLEIIALPCSELSKREKNKKSTTPNCPYYKENYANEILPYSIINDVDYKWSFEKEDDDTNHLLCSKRVKEGSASNREVHHSIILLKQRKCSDGNFSFDIKFSNDDNNLDTDEPYIYILFHFENEANFNALEIANDTLRFIRQKNDKSVILSEFKDREKIRKILKEKEWIHISVHFDKLKFKATINNNEDELELDTDSGDVQMNSLGHVGFLVHNLMEVKFDSILLSSPILHANESFVQAKSKAWGTCEESIHVLNRRSSCETDIYPNETKLKHINCIKNFCEECCLHHTQMLDSNEKKQCEKHCKKNDNLAAKMQTLFEKFLNKCISLEENKDYEKCANNDANCLNKACVLCCKKNDPTKSNELKGLPLHKSKDIQNKEIIECQFQCNRTHGLNK
ncbi:LCCL domain-containing protein [Plasmodium ovale wallikeri]|uniref:LCCL domain-containing protein n=2 Tax=Plasmodium ovale TaxID=36330 RepID=A0A1A8ZIU5_PLAOA|nr:LCCL domain-containing protein [Plasmodium ovale wallikeri]SBT44325.1 LCCL domain-containing protein [Plasmodium ovale wallikeri]SBT78551.1 LCCL domain-containing protein [Plasmodium ovale]